MEAFEKAGARGEVANGAFVTNRMSDPSFIRVYPLLVTRALDEWPERHQRTRAWMSLR